ncbi:maltose alpha-D-glucosyltransferase [Parapedobacter deserti]|uniref:Maltokinase n=1 Tax=Parapedobacter deserti TaxID=1912957 RepID=A0ABV7JR91_9SPHI
MSNSNKLDDKLHWYKDAIIYELHIKAFRDGNGDGIGDFDGLMEKLDYLQDLGVTAIWLLPFYPSPLRDDGYDIADYYTINPSYGDIKQFKRFLNAAHKRGLKVITELVINHTSDQHPWFQRARSAPRGSDERNYYVWTDDPHQFKDARIIFQDFETSNWTWDPVAQQYYWHRFFFHQPDLNYDSPLVQQEIIKILDYWCKMGVDGFRLDAVPYLFERDGTNCENLPETHAFLKKLRKHVDERYPGTLLLAEANMWPEDSAAYFGNGDECQMNYHFPVMPRMFMALQMEDKYPITDIFDQTPEIPETCQWAIFLRNHDELTLEMVTDEERDYMYKVYVKDPKARINLGIRHRLAPLLDNNGKKIELLNTLLFSLPGTPVIYYGDEIGMGDNFYLGDRDGVRTPMQWHSGRNAGFSEANPHRLYLPLILDPQFHYESVNVELQSYNTSSLLWWMKRAISTRKRYKAFSRGDLKFVESENAKVLAFTRTYESQTMLVITNLSRFSQPVELQLGDYKGYVPVEIASRNRFPVIRDDVPYFVTLGAYGSQLFVLEKVHPEMENEDRLHTFRLERWRDLLNRAVVDELENEVLPDYLMRLRWFGGKSRGLESVRVVDYANVPIDEVSTYILLVEVSYRDGLPDLYQLPVAFAKSQLAYKLNTNCPQSVIAYVVLNGDEGILYDAIYGLPFQQGIIKNMAGSHSVPQPGGEVQFSGSPALKEYVRDNPEIKPRVLSGEQSNTSLTYDGKFYLKIYRKVDRAINPDVELTKFLSQKAGFKNIPGYIGLVTWKFGKEAMVLGMMQEMVTGASDGWEYMLDRLNDYNEALLSDANASEPGELIGSLTSPAAYEELPEVLQQKLEATVAELVGLLGVRTAEMHQALASEHNDPAFRPEAYSLHYQRSIFSSLQSMVRAAFQSLSRNFEKLPHDVRKVAKEVLGMKDEILGILKRIYSHKIDVTRIRIHGDYHLGQTLYAGNDFFILDFEGEPARSYSERRLKYSPMRDVAGMIRSFHYAAYGSLLLDNQIRPEDVDKLIPHIEQWYHYMSGFFIKAYLERVQGASFVPRESGDLDILLQTFILQKAIYELNYELNNRPGWVLVPLRGIQSIVMKNRLEKV